MPIVARGRWMGALAGLAPTGVIAAWWVWTGIGVSTGGAIVSLGLLAAIAMTAGWIAGPLSVAVPRGPAKAVVGYAIAVIGTTSSLSIIQAGADQISAGDVSVGGLVTAIAGRALIALAGIAYLILPALFFGVVWVAVARLLLRLARRPA